MNIYPSEYKVRKPAISAYLEYANKLRYEMVKKKKGHDNGPKRQIIRPKFELILFFLKQVVHLYLIGAWKGV